MNSYTTASHSEIAGFDDVTLALKALRRVASSQGASDSELAAILGAELGRLQPILSALAASGFLYKDVLKLYWLGPQLLYLGQQASARNALLYASTEVMDNLMSETQRGVGLIARDKLGVVVVAFRDFPDLQQLIRLPHLVASKGPLHTGGAAKLLLAHAPEDVIDTVIERHLGEFLPATLRTREEVLQLLKQIREDRFYLSIGELHPEVFTVYVPVRDPYGVVIAALGLMGLTNNLDLEQLDLLTTPLFEGAKQISVRLG